MLLEVLHVAWHVVGSLAVGHFLARWWHGRLELQRQARDAAARLGARASRRAHGRRWRRRFFEAGRVLLLVALAATLGTLLAALLAASASR